MKQRITGLAAAIVLGSGAHSALATGFYVESRTTTEGDSGAETVNARVWLEGDNARIEIVDGQMGFFRAGGYMLTNDGGKVIYVVDPVERVYSELDLDQLLGMATAMVNMAGGVMRFEVTDLVNEKVSEGPGDELLGYSTTRYEHRIGYTMSMSVVGFRNTTRSETQQETWCTTEITAPGFRVWASPDRIRTGNADIDAVIENSFTDLGNCLPLRIRSTTTTDGNRRGGDSTATTTTEVTVLREETIDASMFALPADFTARPLVPEMPAGFPAAQEGEVPEPSAERPRIRFRDLIGR